MKITNPIDKDIRMVYLGRELSLKARESSDKFSEEQVMRLKKTFGFLVVNATSEAPVVEKPEKVEPKVKSEIKKEKKEEIEESNPDKTTAKEEKKAPKKESAIKKVLETIKKKK